MLALALFPLVVLSAAALQVTNPSNSSGWETKGSQLIEWTSVSTDPSNFTINVYSPSAPNTAIQVAQHVDTSDGSYTYTPSSDLTAGSDWRVNLVANDGGILAQSDYFTVEEGTSSISSTAVSSTSASASSTSASGSQTSAAASSTSSSAAAASSSNSAADGLVAPGGLLLLVAGAIGVFA